MKNAGVGVGILTVMEAVAEEDVLHISFGPPCIGQGLGTVLVQMTVTNTDHL